MESVVPETSHMAAVSEMMLGEDMSNIGAPSSQIPGTAAHGLINRSKKREPLAANDALPLNPLSNSSMADESEHVKKDIESERTPVYKDALLYV